MSRSRVNQHSAAIHNKTQVYLFNSTAAFAIWQSHQAILWFRFYVQGEIIHGRLCSRKTPVGKTDVSLSQLIRWFISTIRVKSDADNLLINTPLMTCWSAIMGESNLWRESRERVCECSHDSFSCNWVRSHRMIQEGPNHSPMNLSRDLPKQKP